MVPERSLIPFTKFSVDAFRNAERPREKTKVREDGEETTPWRFFLTHFHADHYQGLTEKFDAGIIYTSEITAKLMEAKFGAALVERCVRTLPLDEETVVDGVFVTLVDANHAPGSVQFLFRVPIRSKNPSSSTSNPTTRKDEMKYVHCGDCRWNDAWRDTNTKTGQLLSHFIGCDAIFLDTTYCHPKHVFPASADTESYIANVVCDALNANTDDDEVGILISTYGIGKERILFSILDKCAHTKRAQKIYVTERKLESLKCYVDEYTLQRCFTTDPASSNIHVVKWGTIGETWPYFRPNFVAMEEHRVRMKVQRCIGFVSTGWVASPSSTSTRAASQSGNTGNSAAADVRATVRSKGKCDIHLVPYSEHSSFHELREYVKYIQPKKIVPTVGEGARGDAQSRARSKVLGYFHDLMDKTHAKRSFLSKMTDTPDADVAATLPPLCTTTDIIVIDTHDARDEVEKREGHANENASNETDTLHVLTGIVGGDKAKAQKLLRDASGVLERAANLFLDRKNTPVASAAPGTTGMKRKQRVVGEGPTASQKSLLSYFSPKSKDGRVGDGTSTEGTTKRKRENEKAGTRRELTAAAESERVVVAAQHRKDSRVADDVLQSKSVAKCGSSPPVECAKEASKPHESSSLPYSLVAETLVKAHGTQKRLDIYAYLQSLFATIVERDPSDLVPAIYLVLGKLGDDMTEQIADDEQQADDTNTSMRSQEKKKVLSVSGSVVSSALCTVTSATRGKIRELYRKCGDLGDVACQLKNRQATLVHFKPLTIKGVLETLHSIADESGEGAVARRQSLIVSLLRACQGEETRFIVRTLIANMRIGANSKSIVTALGHTFYDKYLASASSSASKEDYESQRLSKADGVARLARAFSLVPNFSIIVNSLLDKGLLETVQSVRLLPGIPCKPQLAKVAHGIDDVLSFFSAADDNADDDDDKNVIDPDTKSVEVLAERKYDGMRAQIHMMPNGTCCIYSRNCDNVTPRFPELVATMQKMMEDESCSIAGSIFDAEIVAIDRATNTLRSFQELSSRSKDAGNDSNREEVDVCVMLFDLLCTRARGSLVDLPLRERRSEITRVLPSMIPGTLQMAHSQSFMVKKKQREAKTKKTKKAKKAPLNDVSDHEDETGNELIDEENAVVRDAMNAYFEESLEQQCEGLMLKALDSVYAPDSRSSWLKLKKDYCESGRDSLDLVPIGAWYGNGRKAGMCGDL